MHASKIHIQIPNYSLTLTLTVFIAFSTTMFSQKFLQRPLGSPTDLYCKLHQDFFGDTGTEGNIALKKKKSSTAEIAEPDNDDDDASTEISKTGTPPASKPASTAQQKSRGSRASSSKSSSNSKSSDSTSHNAKRGRRATKKKRKKEEPSSDEDENEQFSDTITQSKFSNSGSTGGRWGKKKMGRKPKVEGGENENGNNANAVKVRARRRGCFNYFVLFFSFFTLDRCI